MASLVATTTLATATAAAALATAGIAYVDGNPSHFNPDVPTSAAISPSSSSSTSYSSSSDSPTSGLPQTPWSAFCVSFAVIAVSELGDKTFLISAVLAMRNPRWLVFVSAMASLTIMTLLAGLLGRVLPSLLSPEATQWAAVLLLIGFGVKMAWEAYRMTGDEGVKELEGLEKELEAESSGEDDESSECGKTRLSDVESGVAKYTDVGGDLASDQPNRRRKLRRWFKQATGWISPVFLQAFVLTFLAEWGDRSQIATIALAGAHDFWFVMIGALLGHAACAIIAVVGGRLLAERISVKSVTIFGSIILLSFGIVGVLQLSLRRDSGATGQAPDIASFS
ncbi:hypothetical protein DFJ73DRAFT_633557 [Zopfochytrium polystomum]|nr:hypothetical protein DFJ73DRAFT_633557 [Zopfochytrium polystomum]